MFSASTVSCHVELARTTKIFYSGDEVCGKITLKVAKKVYVEAISINIVRLEHIEWLECGKDLTIFYDDSSTQNDNFQKLRFENEKKFILASVELTEHIPLESGEISAQFTLCLPDELLSTSKHRNGYVDYHLEVILQTRKMTKKIFGDRLFLRNRLDLNKESKLTKPWIITCRLPCSEINVTVPYTGFVPGQFIPLKVKMTHLLFGYKTIINCVEKLTYESDNSLQTSKEVIKIHDNAILSSSSCCQLRVPFTTAISTTLDDALMKVSYYLECLVISEKLEAVHTSRIPITVGNVALKQSEKPSSDHIDRLYSYNNLGAMKDDLEICVQPNLVKFDIITCQPNNFFKNNKNHFMVQCREAILHLEKLIYKQIPT